jgi:hypothetical protein
MIGEGGTDYGAEDSFSLPIPDARPPLSEKPSLSDRLASLPMLSRLSATSPSGGPQRVLSPARSLRDLPGPPPPLKPVRTHSGSSSIPSPLPSPRHLAAPDLPSSPVCCATSIQRIAN